MTPLLEAIFGLGCLVSSVIFMTLTLRAIRIRRQADVEFHEWLQDFLKAQADNRRTAELRILKHLKGDSYQGEIGEFEVHTDPLMPSGMAALIPPPPPKKKKGNWW